MNKIINILVVDDSPTMRQMLINMMSGHPSLRVVGEARHGEEAVRLTQRLKPDVISMDIHMPVMDGFDATKEIMQVQPTPIVVVSGSFEHSETSVAFESIKRGALAVLQKPPSFDHPDYPRCRDRSQAPRLRSHRAPNLDVEGPADRRALRHRSRQVTTASLCAVWSRDTTCRTCATRDVPSCSSCSSW